MKIQNWFSVCRGLNCRTRERRINRQKNSIRAQKTRSAGNVSAVSLCVCKNVERTYYFVRLSVLLKMKQKTKNKTCRVESKTGTEKQVLHWRKSTQWNWIQLQNSERAISFAVAVAAVAAWISCGMKCSSQHFDVIKLTRWHTFAIGLNSIIKPKSLLSIKRERNEKCKKFLFIVFFFPILWLRAIWFAQDVNIQYGKS